ncbi:MAG: trehalose operon repressor [Limosilactobacillus sp.]|uniref:trehalose operon repressor n=1 Tax=Limosilactobacillus sp. TaxID=2773925 RepID=UPI002701587C|nr:trehalose operon repressor [Limosilactobacillus sp.]
MESKHEIIKQDLAEKIKRGFYKPGTLIPSETEMTTLYGVSRETVRKALQSLADLGLIHKMRGRGSVVIDNNRHTFPISQLTSFQELNKAEHLKAETKVLECQYPVNPPTQFIGHDVPQYSAQFVRRVRIIDGENSVVDEDYLLHTVELPIDRSVFVESLYNFLEKQAGYTIGYATKSVTFEHAPEEIGKILDCDTVAVIRSLVYLEDNKLFQLTTSYHKPDQFQFIDFARRKKL